jgi:hypothetical protein
VVNTSTKKGKKTKKVVLLGMIIGLAKSSKRQFNIFLLSVKRDFNHLDKYSISLRTWNFEESVLCCWTELKSGLLALH